MNLILISKPFKDAGCHQQGSFKFNGFYKGIKISRIALEECFEDFEKGEPYLLLLKEVKIEGTVLVAKLTRYKLLKEVCF